MNKATMINDELTPAELRLFEMIAREFPDLNHAQTARIVIIVREWIRGIADEAERKMPAKARVLLNALKARGAASRSDLR